MAGGAFIAQAIVGCGPRPRPALAATAPGDTVSATVVDAHCHLFNITDLPASSFIQVSYLDDYEQSSAAGPWLKRAERLLQRGVPTAADELSSIGRGWKSTGSVEKLSREEERELDEAIDDAGSARASAASATFRDPRCLPEGGAGPAPNLRSIVHSYRNLRASRHRLSQRLVRSYAAEGVRPALLCPALVDYSHWLSQPLRSDLVAQVRVMGALARQPDLPPVHGYAPYDPLRHAMMLAGKPRIDPPGDPLALLREAVNTHGFIGVKLYPPMGFRAGRNSGSGDRYPRRIEEAFGGSDHVARALDAALELFWNEVEALGIGVMAHGAWSNQGGCGFGRRADPYSWLPVFENRRGIPVMLAHFGGFSTPSADPDAGDRPEGELPFERSWEGTLARYIRRFPGAPIFGDISFLSEIWDRAGRDLARRRLQTYAEYDPKYEHLVFGSDWIVLGLDKRWDDRPGYATSVMAFLREAGISDEGLNNIMVNNALRFLQLQSGQRNRGRLEAFHAADPARLARIPLPGS